MGADLLKYARGHRKAVFLDDRLHTINAEREVLEQDEIPNREFEQPYGFLSHVLSWFDEREKWDKDEQFESTCLLVVDVNLPEAPDLRELIKDVQLKIRLPQQPELLDTANGERAGIVLLDLVLRRDSRLKSLPVIVLSGYRLGQGGVRMESIARRRSRTPVAPAKFVTKALVTDDHGARFGNAARDLLYDRRLMFMHRLADQWGLGEDEICGMLGLRDNRIEQIGVFFDRGHRFPSIDPEQRAKHLYAVHKNLHNLLNDADVVAEWLRSKNGQLGGRRPIDLLTSREFEDVAIVRAYVDTICGR